MNTDLPYAVVTEDHQGNIVELDDEKIRAVLIESSVLDDRLWFVIDPQFEPGDGLPLYFADELPLFGKMSADALQRIHKYKKMFLGSHVRSPEDLHDQESTITV